MKKVYMKIKNLNNKLCLSKGTKLRHFNTVGKQDVVYASETILLLGCKMTLEGWKRDNEKYWVQSERVTERDECGQRKSSYPMGQRKRD